MATICCYDFTDILEFIKVKLQGNETVHRWNGVSAIE